MGFASPALLRVVERAGSPRMTRVATLGGGGLGQALPGGAAAGLVLGKVAVLESIQTAASNLLYAGDRAGAHRAFYPAAYNALGAMPKNLDDSLRKQVDTAADRLQRATQASDRGTLDAAKTALAYLGQDIRRVQQGLAPDFANVRIDQYQGKSLADRLWSAAGEELPKSLDRLKVGSVDFFGGVKDYLPWVVGGLVAAVGLGLTIAIAKR